jgi:hypothetical protein
MKDHVDEAEIIADETPIDDVTENQEPVTDEDDGGDNDNETQEATEETLAEDDESEVDDKFVVSFGDEVEADEEPEAESSVLRVVRQNAREEKRKRKELEKKLEELTAQQPVELGAKPTLRDCDYDDAKFEAELIAFNERKTAIAGKAKDEKSKQDVIQKEFDDKFNSYKAGSVDLGRDDFDDTEAVVTDILSVVQQSVLVQVAENPAQLVYALGKYPDQAEKLAKITNPVQLAAAIARMETKMTVPSKKSKPAPERRMKSGAAIVVSGEKKLEQLRTKAEESGDYSEVRAYKRALREK